MTTDLDERITRALGARADALTVTRPPLDDVLAGPAPARARPSGRRRPALLVAAAALVVLGIAATVVATRPDDGGGRVDLRPAEEITTTTEPGPPEMAPGFELSFLPEDIDRGTMYSSFPPGALTRRVQAGVGDRQVVVTVDVVDRPAPLAEAIAERDGTAMVAAYAEGNGARTIEELPEPEWADAIPVVGAGDLTDVELVGEEPVLSVATRRFGQVDVDQPARLVAFPSPFLEVRVSGTGLGLDELVAVLQGLRGEGLVPADRTDAGLPEVAEGASTTSVGLADLPAGLVLAETSRFVGVVGEDIAWVRYRLAGPAAQSGVLPGAPWFGVTLTRQPVAAEVQEALASGDRERIRAAVPITLPIAADITTRVEDIDGRPVVWATASVQSDEVLGLEAPRTVSRLIVHLGPDAVVTLEAEGVGDADLRAAVASLRVIT